MVAAEAIYVTGAAVSALLTTIALALFMLVYRATLHPSQLLVFKFGADLLGSLNRLWVYGAMLSSGTQSMTGCAAYRVVGRYLLSASELWSLILSVDLFVALRNPFTAYPENYPRYHLTAWLGAAAATILSVLGLGEKALSVTEPCWAVALEGRPPTLSSYLTNFPILLLLVVISSIYVLHRVRSSLPSRGVLAATMVIRVKVMAQGMRYVMVFGMWLLARLAFWVTQVAAQSDQARDHAPFTYVEAALDVLLGVANLLAMFISIRSNGVQLEAMCRPWRQVFLPNERSPLLELDQARKEGPKQQSLQSLQDSNSGSSTTGSGVYPSWNWALRQDIVVCASWGIVDAVQTPCVNSTSEVRTKTLPPAYERVFFDFIDYEGEKFRHIRSLFRLTDVMYLQSFLLNNSDDNRLLNIICEQFTEGRSGSFFYYTFDRRFCIKTVSVTERNLLLSFLDGYINHMNENPASLIVKICGLYGVRLSREQKFIYLMVMENVFWEALEANLHINERYDLKGATVARRAHKSVTTANRTLKDLDLQRVVRVGTQAKAALVSQVVSDCSFLNENGLMDYSLLLGVHDCVGTCRHALAVQRPLLPPSSPVDYIRGGLHAVHEINTEHDRAQMAEGPATLFFCGVVDILQEYTFKKRLERILKINVLCQSGRGISTMAPDDYAMRFLRMISSKFT